MQAFIQARTNLSKIEIWCTNCRKSSHAIEDCYCEAFGHPWENYRIILQHVRISNDTTIDLTSTFEGHINTIIGGAQAAKRGKGRGRGGRE